MKKTFQREDHFALDFAIKLPQNPKMRQKFCRFANASLMAAIMAAAPVASAQVTSKQFLHITVTDPHNRFVVGLQSENFQVLENGVRLVTTEISNPDTAISLAIVSAEPVPSAKLAAGIADELFQASSVSAALRQLAASKNSRKVILILDSSESQTIPGGIQALISTRENLSKTIIELRNQYQIQFESSNPSARLEVVIKPLTVMPVMQAHWK